jgi:hypothetical protein
MTRYTKSEDGKYHIKGHKYDFLIGSRAQVWHGTAYKTSGELVKSDLIKNKNERIVSKAKHHTAKKEKRLLKHGYGTKKGQFGFVKMNKKSRKMRGGSVYGSGLSPASFKSDGHEVPHDSNNVQFRAGMAGGNPFHHNAAHVMHKKGGAHAPAHHNASSTMHHVMHKKGGAHTRTHHHK